jgi:hypothetical protein
VDFVWINGIIYEETMECRESRDNNMNSILIVGEDKQQRRYTSYYPQTVSWAGFSKPVQDRARKGVTILNLTDPAALTLAEAIHLPERNPGLRVLYVLETLETVTNLPAASRSLLTRPGVDILTTRADQAEFEYRVQRLLELSTAPASVLTAPAPSLSGLLPELHDPRSGRIDARRLADRFGLPLTALARTLGREHTTIHRTPASRAIQDGLRIYLRIASALHRLVGSDVAERVWLNAPNPDLGSERPRTLMERSLDDAEIVAELLEDSLLGMPG